MKKIATISLILAAGIFSSCLRLDNNLYNNSEKITEYKRDNYTGKVDFVLDYSYHIPDSLVSIFTLASTAPGESNSTKIYAMYIGDIAKIATDTVIMYCHGNKWHMDFYWQRAKLLANTGGKNHYGVMLVDYRGYGLSEGKPSEEGLYADVDACLQWLKMKGLSNSRLMMYGFSMGTAPATNLTANPRSMTPSKLILEAPFASAAVMVQDASQLALPGSYVTNLKIDNAEQIKKVTQPFMWMHGNKDLFLNYQTHGQVIYNNYAGVYKESHIVDGADHGEVPQKDGYIKYSTDLYNFIRK